MGGGRLLGMCWMGVLVLVIGLGWPEVMEAIKDPRNLASAFVRALELHPAAAKHLRLVVVGDGALRQDVAAALEWHESINVRNRAQRQHALFRRQRHLELSPRVAPRPRRQVFVPNHGLRRRRGLRYWAYPWRD